MYSRKKSVVLAIITTCLLSSASAALASGKAGAGRHNLVVLTHAKVSSIRVFFTDNRRNWHNRCVDVSRQRGWKDTKIRVFNGSSVYVQTFSQPACLEYITTSELDTVPGENGLTNFWYSKAAQ